MPEFDRQEPVYLISVAAKLCSVHPQTLRLYERLGLVAPARISRKNRMYSEADVERLKQIQHFTQDMGVNLAGVEVILGLLEKMLRLQDQMEAEIERLRRLMEDQARRLEKFTS